MFIAVTDMVLAELAGRIAEVLQELRNRRVLGTEALHRAREADLGQAGADRLLAGDEGGAPSGATLLTVEVGEHRALSGDPVDVRGAIPHDAVVVTTDVEPADVVAHDEQNVRMIDIRHDSPPNLSAPRALTARRPGRTQADDHGLLITLGMYSCRFQASTDETVNNVTPEAAGSVMGAETPLPGVETNHVLHNETASCLAFAASRLVIAEPFQGGLRTSLITVAATVLRRINHKQAMRTGGGAQAVATDF